MLCGMGMLLVFALTFSWASLLCISGYVPIADDTSLYTAIVGDIPVAFT